MQFAYHLSVTCDDCGTQYVPTIVGEGAGPARAAVNADETTIEIRIVPRCPACNAVGSMLRRAGLRRVADQLS